MTEGGLGQLQQCRLSDDRSQRESFDVSRSTGGQAFSQGEGWQLDGTGALKIVTRSDLKKADGSDVGSL